jgi:hypothetical protein
MGVCKDMAVFQRLVWECEGEWNARRHGDSNRRVWRKAHLGIDEETLEIRAVEFTSSDVGDAPMLPELLDQIPPGQEIAGATANQACDTRKCPNAIADRGAATVCIPRQRGRSSLHRRLQRRSWSSPVHHDPASLGRERWRTARGR